MAIEINSKSPEVPPQFRFFSGMPVSKEASTPGVTPNMEYATLTLKGHPDLPENFNLYTHPDFGPALKALVDEWGDKDSFWWTADPDKPKKRFNEFKNEEKPTTPANEFHLYSFGERKAIVKLPDGKYQKKPSLEVLADHDKLADHSDANMNQFENLMSKHLARYAGERAKEEGSGEYVAPAYSTILEYGTFPQDAVTTLDHSWPGNRDVFFTVTQNGVEQVRRLGSFPTYGGTDEDFKLRLSITKTEKVLSLGKQPIAHLVSRYVERRNQDHQPSDDAPIPLPVITPQEVHIVGDSPEQLEKNTRFILRILTQLTRRQRETEKETYEQEVEAVVTSALLALDDSPPAKKVVPIFGN